MSILTVLLVGLFVLQIVAGNNPFIVGLFGLRSYLLPFPVMFIMAENLDEEDLRKLGACTLWLLLPMTLLVLAQYEAPGGSFLNRGAYEGGSQLGYTGGHVRPSGTFSFSIGVVHFVTLAGAFILYGMVREEFVKRWVLWASAFALILSVPAAGARTLLGQLAAVIGCVVIGAFMGVSQFGKVLRVIVPVAILAFLAALLPVFSDAMHSMAERFSGANTAEGGSAQSALYYRTVQPAVNAIEKAVESNNWLGIGMGRGAVAVQALLHGTTEAEAGEDEFSREFVEMGPIGGMAFELFKMFLAIAMLGSVLAKMREHETLALLMLPLAISTLLLGVPEQTTVQGFMVISVAFCLAAAKVPERVAEQVPLVLQRQQPLYRFRVQRR
jgi:hypothetical protein